MNKNEVLLLSSLIPGVTTTVLILFTHYDPLPTSLITAVFIAKFLEENMEDPPSFKKLYKMTKDKLKQGIAEYHRWQSNRTLKGKEEWWKNQG